VRVIGCSRSRAVFARELWATSYLLQLFTIPAHGFPQHIEVLSAVGALNQLPMHSQTSHFSSSISKLRSVYLLPISAMHMPILRRPKSESSLRTKSAAFES